MTKPDTGGRGEWRRALIERAKRFAWGYQNVVGGSDDWCCDAVREYDEFGDELDYDRDPCECPECDGASARLFDRGKPSLSTRVKLNLAARAVASATNGGRK